MRCSRLESWALALALSFLVLLTGWDAQAQLPDETSATELVTLEQGLDDELASLSTADCITACLALESMIRSAERICVLAPGPRCEAARDKVDAARRLVQERCPECAAATAAKEAQRPEPAEPLVAPAAGGDEQAYADEPAQAPPAEDRAGGCAACALGAPPRDDAAMWMLLALALAALRRARR